jgi:hypothetical protein
MRAIVARTKSQRETTMTIKSKIATAVAIATLAGSLAIPTSAAQARGGWGLGAAVLGAAIVGATVANSAPYGGYYAVDGVRRCGWERQYDRYGFYIGTVKVCRVY